MNGRLESQGEGKGGRTRGKERRPERGRGAGAPEPKDLWRPKMRVLSAGRRDCRWGEAQAARRGAPAERGSKLQHAGLSAAPTAASAGVQGAKPLALRVWVARVPQAWAASSCYSEPRRVVPARG